MLPSSNIYQCYSDMEMSCIAPQLAERITAYFFEVIPVSLDHNAFQCYNNQYDIYVSLATTIALTTVY